MEENNLNIGLLGGSFNPPHKGHLYISHDALKRFNLDSVWWIITPQNPLKNTKPPSISTRKQWCNEVIDTPKIQALDIEKDSKTNKTSDLLKFIIPKYGNNKYIWIMGLDNLLSFDKWSNWQEVLRRVKIAVYTRPGFQFEIQNKTLLSYQKSVKDFMDTNEPCWSLFNVDTPDISSTIMRAQNDKTK